MGLVQLAQSLGTLAERVMCVASPFAASAERGVANAEGSASSQDCSSTSILQSFHEGPKWGPCLGDPAGWIDSFRPSFSKPSAGALECPCLEQAQARCS